MFTTDKITHDLGEIAEFLLSERSKALSEAEWRFRMRGYGYKLRRVEDGVEVARLPQNTVLGTIHV